MHRRTFHRLILAVLALMLSTLGANAQWRTESFELKAGWNAIFLSVDASDRPMKLILKGYPKIDEIWRWNPGGLDSVAIDSPTDPIYGQEWGIWRRLQAGQEQNTMMSLLPHFGYLVKVREGSAPITLKVKGKVVMPRLQWRTDGLNLIGFPAETTPAPTLSAYLRPAGLNASSTIYQYQGGDIDSNPVEVLNPAGTALERGKAYWIDTGRYTDFYGPVKVEVSSSSFRGLDYGALGSLQRVVFTNRTEEQLTVSLNLEESEPGRQNAPVIPAVLSERIIEDGAVSYRPIVWPLKVVVGPGDTVGTWISLDRTQLPQEPGKEIASLLTVTDSSKLSRIYVPVSATTTDAGGLWVGEAVINKVQNQLQQFERVNGEYVYDEEEAEIPDPDNAGQTITVLRKKRRPLAGTGDSALNATKQELPIRLIVHVDADKNTRLLSTVYAGPIATEVEGAAPAFGITTDPDQLDQASLKESVRLTSVHFPLDLNLALGNAFIGGGSLSGPIVLNHDARDNPFVHVFHPDHDNLTPDFNASRPIGEESFEVTRDLKLVIDRAAPDGRPGWGTTHVTGTYSEEIKGIHKNPISVEGRFELRRISDVDTLQ